jgi:hypothetical protein
VSRAIPFVGFAQDVLGVRLTLGQRTLARIGFDGAEPGELQGEERDMAARLLGPIETIEPSARLVLTIVKGARIGGSYVFGGLYSLWRALTADLSRLAPGEQAVALIVAPDLRLARQVLRYALGAAESVPSIARLIESKSTDSFALRRPDGALVAIECLPATRGGSAVRGRSLVSAVLSETAFFRDSSAVVNDLDVFKAVMPRVMPGGLTVLESTPWVEAGLLYDEFSRNFGAPVTSIAALAPTLVMRDDERTAQIVANEMARDPENAAREFGAEWISGGSGLFFGPELLRPALDESLSALDVAPTGAIMTIGGDVGLVTDATAFAAVARIGNVVQLCNVLEMRPKRGAPLKLSEAIGAGCEFAGRYGQRRIIVDHHELTAGREHLLQGFSLEPCAGGGDAKEARYIRVRDALREGRIRIPAALVRVTNQLSMVIGKPRPGGGTAIILPRRAGTHLDLCSAFILAADGGLQGGGGLNYGLALHNYRAIRAGLPTMTPAEWAARSSKAAGEAKRAAIEAESVRQELAIRAEYRGRDDERAERDAKIRELHEERDRRLAEVANG